MRIQAPIDVHPSKVTNGTESREIVIVVSMPGTGSSWLARLLRAHPELLVYTHNTNDNHLLYLLNPLKSLNPLGDDYIDVNSRLDRLFWRTKLRLLRRFHPQPSAGLKLLIATPTTAAFLPLIVEGFPYAKYVHLQRDPFDRISSFRKFMEQNAERGFSEQYKSSRHGGILFALRQALPSWFHALRWVRFRHSGYLGTRPLGFQKAASLPFLEFLCWYYNQYEREISQALAQVPADRKYVCTYEGLVRDYTREIRKLMRFIGVDIREDFLEKTTATIKKERIGGHKISFSKEELDDLQRYLAAYERNGF